VIVRRVGLLGGSFNPAHDGHVHISECALRRLRLDQVWWLVTPQNPLKSVVGMAPFAERLAAARAFVETPRIVVSDYEARAGTRYTIEALERLVREHRGKRFVWLMGADNLMEAHRWRRWTSIFNTVPIAVFARPTYSLRALSAKAVHRFAGARVAESQASALADMRPPAWVFLNIRLHDASATRIRAQRGAERDTGTFRGASGKQQKGSGS
jgi:nicotinate-nucleotide adenylyltransferase